MYKQQTQCKINTTGLRDTRQHLDDCTITPTGASHKHLHINPIKKREKEVATSLVRVDPQHGLLAPLVPRASRASRASRLSCLAPLVPRASQQRAPSTTCTFHNVHLPLRLSSTLLCAASQAASLSQVHTQNSLSRAPLEHVRLTHSSTQTCFLLPTLRPALFWARCNRVRQSGEDTPPLPLPLLASETGR